MTTLEIHLSAWLLLGKPPATFRSARKRVAGKEGAAARVQQEESFITAKLIHSTRGGPVSATGARGQVCEPTRSRAHVTPTHQGDSHVPPEAPPTHQFRQQLRHFLYLRFWPLKIKSTTMTGFSTTVFPVMPEMDVPALNEKQKFV